MPTLLSDYLLISTLKLKTLSSIVKLKRKEFQGEKKYLFPIGTNSFCIKNDWVLRNQKSADNTTTRRGMQKNTENPHEIVQNREKRAGEFLIEHVPTNVGQVHGNGNLAGGKREVSKQFKCHTSKKGKIHYHSMSRQCLTGMLISLCVPKTMNK